MNRRILKIVMSIIFLVGVYVASCIFLPKSFLVNKTASKNAVKGEDEVETVDLSTKKVVLDSGHGGFDPGKESKSGIKEKDINLSIAFQLKKLLEDSGIEVVMTRTDDQGLYSENDSNKKAADMKARCKIIDDAKPDIVVSIHQNSFQSSSIKGAQCFYYKHSADGKKLAETLQEALKNDLDSSNDRVEKSDTSYYMLVHTSAPTVIAECGFLSNPEEAAKLNSEEYQKQVAQALYNGIIEYLTHA